MSIKRKGRGMSSPASEASVCHSQAESAQGEPVPSALGEHPQLQAFLTQGEGRDSTPSLEAGRASRSGLLEISLSTGLAIVLWVAVDRGKGKA